MKNVVTATRDFFGSYQKYFVDLDCVTKWTGGIDLEIDYDKIKKADLVIFTGGEDVNPAYYGEKNTYSPHFNPQRDWAEFRVFSMAMELNKKILGCCRGHQIISVLQGEKLIQDIGMVLNSPHRGDHSLENIVPGSLAERFFSSGVNSLHHQGSTTCSFGKITATHKGIIEMTESENIITCQFHPEWMNAKEFFRFLAEEW